ncbi:MAG TPA: alternative ribosome rescue aminoacyl-tRNA hydrolase ArfB [Candidatus Deferrimicrobiaceae bacterium]|jgi:ribosome-associated protein
MPDVPAFAVPESELQEEFIRSPGPGGQNVNKVATAVRLRFNAVATRLLGDDARARLIRLAGKRMTAEGFLVIEAHRFRTRERNRQDARDRLGRLIAQALEPPPPPRKKTKPSRGSKERRLESKRRQGETKRRRTGPSDE